MAEAAGAACPAADGMIAGVRAWQQLDLSADAVAKKEATLSHYRREVDELKAKKQYKPDMQAYKKLRDQYTPPEDVFGHIPGVRVGEEFGGRGELAILGLHKRILQGIDGSPTSAFGAAAICLSGGYKDDEDQGTTFWYTGQGGNQGGVQVQDQKWEQGNVALRTSCQTGVPVRVMRGSKVDGAVRYAYDGLYKVKQFKMEPSAHGPLVIKFLMEGIPGESAASHKVDYLSMFNRGQHSMLSCRLAASDEEEDEEEDEALGRGKRRRHRPALTAEQEAKKRSAEDRQAARKRRLAEIRAMPGVVMEDVSDGLERIPIPVVNTVNNTPLMPLTYITDYQFAPFVEDLVQPLLDEQNEQMLRYVGGNECGLDFGRMMMAQDRTLPSDNVHKRKDCQNYNHKGLLMLTYPFGVHECCDKCTHKQCQRNKQVSGGISLPLEVFMTEDRGWGVRCATDIKAGQFVACYIGEVITEGMAERRRQKDAYLFNLDHFSILFQEVQNTQCDIPEWHLPPAPPTDAHLRLLARMKDMRPAFEEKVKQAEAVRKAFEEERAQAAAAAAAACEAASAGGNGATDQQGKVEGGEAGPQGVGSGVDAVEGDAVCQVSSASAECKDVASRDAPGDEGAPEAGPSLAAPSQSAGLGSEGAAGSDGAPAAAPSRQQSEPGSNWALETTKEALEDALGEWPDPDPQVLLAVDAMHRGNVARFINHSCEPNLTIQAVFSRKARNVLYFYHGLFASVDIPAHTELTYSYGEQYVPKRLKCQCGAPSCLSNVVPS